MEPPERDAHAANDVDRGQAARRELAWKNPQEIDAALERARSALASGRKALRLSPRVGRFESAGLIRRERDRRDGPEDIARTYEVDPCPGSTTDSSLSARATARTSGSAVAILSPDPADAINTASAREIGREER